MVGLKGLKCDSNASILTAESSPAGLPHSANVQRASVSSVTMVRSFGKVDSDGSRYLLSDIKGTLWLLALITDAASSSIMVRLLIMLPPPPSHAPIPP